MQKKDTDQGNPGIPDPKDGQNPAEESTEVKQLRTYTNDIAELILTNKLSEKELAHIDPRIVEAVRSGEYTKKFIIPKKVKSKNLSDALANELHDKEMPDQMLDLDQLESVAQKTRLAGTPSSIPEPSLKSVEALPVEKTEELKQPDIVLPEEKKELTPAEQLKQEEQQLEAELVSFKDEEKRLHDKEASLGTEIDAAKTKSQPLKLREQEVEKQETDVEQKVRQSGSPLEKRDLEKQRWNLEDERQHIEQERWTMDERIITLEKEINENKKQEAALDTKEAQTAKKLQKVKKKEIAMEAQGKKEELAKKFEDIKNSRAQLETAWKDIMSKKQAVTEKEQEIAKQKETLESEIKSIDTSEHKASNPATIHEIESERWKKDKELRNVEEREWHAGEEELALQKSIADIEKQSQEVLHLERTTKNQIDELDALIKEGID
jgi:chromosome segregation ATPase